MSAPRTAAQKILARAAGLPHVDIGQVVHPDPELVIIHDGYVETVHAELTGLGFGRPYKSERVMFVTDHEITYPTQRAVHARCPRRQMDGSLEGRRRFVEVLPLLLDDAEDPVRWGEVWVQLDRVVALLERSLEVAAIEMDHREVARHDR